MTPLVRRGVNDDFLCFPCPATDEAESSSGGVTRLVSKRQGTRQERENGEKNGEKHDEGEGRSEEKVFNLSCPTM